MRTNRQWRLKQRPRGTVGQDTLELVTGPARDLADGEVLVRNVYLSLDPTNRIWMSDMQQYMPPVAVGEVMRGGTIGRVVESRDPSLAVGDWVTGLGQWQDYWVGPAAQMSKLAWDGRVPLTIFFGLLGMIGCTAYFGMLEIGDPQPGETVVVSGAAGAVGSIAGQLAKIRGARVIGIAGTQAKCDWLVRECGFDAAIDYRAEDVGARLDALAPDGIDVYFDNVGGRITEAVFDRLNQNARVPLCGLISTYNSPGPTGPANYHMILMQRVMVRGFIVLDYLPRFPEAIAQLAQWYAAGRIHYRVDVRDGLERAPEHLNALFDGSNDGKLIVRIADEAEARA
jgi:NADPH-dependent curcumin reductase CurA